MLFSIKRYRYTGRRVGGPMVKNHADAEQQVEQLEEMVSLSSLTNKELKNNVIEDVRKQQKKVLHAILRKKMIKHEQEPNLLSWDAKEQIRFLNNEDPESWNPHRLSECFPISEDGVIRLLKSNYVPGSIEEIVKHDKIVAERWKDLTGKAGPHSKYKHLWNMHRGIRIYQQSSRNFYQQIYIHGKTREELQEYLNQ